MYHRIASNAIPGLLESVYEAQFVTVRIQSIEYCPCLASVLAVREARRKVEHTLPSQVREVQGLNIVA